MENEQDIRWIQRLSNYNKAVQKITEALKVVNRKPKKNYGDEYDEDGSPIDNSDDDDDIIDDIDELIKEGIIQRFEYTHELAWNVMKDYAEYQGNSEIRGSRDATKEAFKMKLISNGSEWMDMIVSRNKTTHTYNEDTANEIFLKVINDYYPLFVDFKNIMKGLKYDFQPDLFN